MTINRFFIPSLPTHRFSRFSRGSGLLCLLRELISNAYVRVQLTLCAMVSSVRSGIVLLLVTRWEEVLGWFGVYACYEVLQLVVGE